MATHNRGKQGELATLLSERGWRGVPADAWGAGEPEESEPSYAGNALLKARAASQTTGWPAVGDDTGLEIEGHEALLGLHTKRWIDAQGGRSAAFEVLRRTLRFDEKRTSACLVCALAWVWPSGSHHVRVATLPGWLHWPPTSLPGPAGVFETGEGPLWSGGVLLHRRRAFGALSDDLSAIRTPDA